MPTIKSFDKGLFLHDPVDEISSGGTISNRGLSNSASQSFKSRFGSTLIADLDPHSIISFNNSWYTGVDDSLYRGLNPILSGLSGNLISFAKSPPTAGVVDYLFLTDGSTLRKSDTTGNLTNWGITPPVSNPVAATNSDDYTSIRSATYIWTVSGSGTNEFYCTLAASTDPSLLDPTFVREDSVKMTLGVLGSLAVNEYAYGDNDVLGFSTIYVRLADSADPDSKAAGWVDYTDATFSLDNGTYQYKITYLNSTTGTRSNENPAAASILIVNQAIDISSIPDGSLVDPQVNYVEIWRTVADGNAFFYLDRVAAGTTIYADDGSVSLSSIELPLDNIKPFTYFTDCLGPFNASMFWIARNSSGNRGRLFYSPIGRAEAVQGFIEVTNDSNVLQRIFRFQGQLGVIAEAGIFLIGGANPYSSREVVGCPGTTEPQSVVETPLGIVYRASDGLRLFDGSQSRIISPNTVDRLFTENTTSQSTGDLDKFGTIKCASRFRDEYIISDGVQSIAYSPNQSRYRDLGVGFDALYYEQETEVLAGNFNNQLISFEKSNNFKDYLVNIPVILEPPHFKTTSDNEIILQFLMFDVYLGEESLDISLIIDGVESVISTIQSTTRSIITLHIGQSGKIFGLRLVGSLSKNQIEIFSIKAVTYSPGG